MANNYPYFIRTPIENEATIIAQISVQCWQESYQHLIHAATLSKLCWKTRAKQRKQFFQADPNRGSLVIVVHEQIIGFCDFGPQRVQDQPIEKQGEKTAEIFAIYILKEYIGQGLGQALFKEVIQHLKKFNYTVLSVWALKKNKRAIDFYKKQNGLESKHRMIEMDKIGYEEIQWIFKIG